MVRESAAAAELKGIRFAYEKDEVVLQGVDLRVENGEWIAIVGASGCGKSTLVRLLNALLRPQGGTVEVFGEELAESNAPLVRSRIGMVFQNPDNQFIGETVEEDIAFGLEGLCLERAEMERRIRVYARKLNVEPLLRRHPSELSGGQKQRCAIASCLAMEPEIVVFDEATSMQDENSRREMLNIMADMQARGGYTIFSVTHDADEMLAADRIVALKDGTVRADRSPGDFFADEELLRDCGIEMPFRLRLERELGRRGLIEAEAGRPASGSGSVSAEQTGDAGEKNTHAEKADEGGGRHV
ncbi:ATP-binding cassette domain-containing protein [Saccharibacillus sp. CPCC 101409]|uniref:ATP-binding cassette domain-containing protein n=1 Tax=Saccharibacillus sp. CPCC 101409 TaxID=3058041 RepID=UPI002673B524|nr:ATP-binding cassette domain-containing protein [Saccharibacillus sp. CPCC 101409]MDO3411429.1 ATP-binding cassette domain-containing protein [Saccharibacillus sp. CPCC 101409]